MTNLEAVCVRIQQRKGWQYVYCLYIQPTSEIDTYAAHMHAIEKLDIKSEDSLIIAGDFNLPIVKWIESDESGDLIPIIGEYESVEARIARHVTDSMSQMGLSQLNNVQNTSGNVLDLIYTNVPELTVSEKAIRLLIPAVTKHTTRHQYSSNVIPPYSRRTTTSLQHIVFGK